MRAAGSLSPLIPYIFISSRVCAARPVAGGHLHPSVLEQPAQTRKTGSGEKAGTLHYKHTTQNAEQGLGGGWRS